MATTDEAKLMSDAHNFRKADPPATGPAFDNTWMEPFKGFAGAPALMFDVSKLTLADYAEMRNHPQVNASLSMMTFMLHQCDWYIECEDKKVGALVEENMRLIWTELVRGISTAYWAGASPMVLEWDNVQNGRYTFVTKIKDLHPSSAEVNWLEVDSSYTPRPQDITGSGRNYVKPKVKVFDGIQKEGLSYPIPPMHSLWYPLLRERNDYSGRKLLAPAFAPWYFSLLMHLFSNRYFERFGEPTPIGRAPFNEEFQFQDANGNDIEMTGKQVVENAISRLRSSGSVVLPSDRDPTASVRSEYMYDIEYLECTSGLTEIMTSEGWTTYDKLQIGDSVLTLNHEIGASEWQPVLKVNVHDVVDREVLSIEMKGHSSLTTLGHRWPVDHNYDRRGCGRQSRNDWVESGDLTAQDSLIASAYCADLPTEPKFTDAIVELVAWYWTEGHQKKLNGVPGRNIQIDQSQKVNPTLVERIRLAMTSAFGPSAAGRLNAKGEQAIWSEYAPGGNGNVTFFLSDEAAKTILAIAPNKEVDYGFLRSLTQAQLDLFIKVSLLADGNKKDNNLWQNDLERCKRFEFACILAGHSTSLRPQKDGWIVQLKKRSRVSPVRADVQAGWHGRKPVMERVRYTGVVWCPTTENGSWLARHNGTVYFTGNSQMRGADFERYMSRLDEEISLAIFTPMLLMRSGDRGSLNLGIQHANTWAKTLNALAEDIAEYVNPYLVERIKAVNFSPNAPKCKWVMRGLGKDNDETIRAMVTTLLREGAAKVDLDELGMALGMTLTEVRQAQGQQTDPPQDDPRGDVGRSDRNVDGPATTSNPTTSRGVNL